jgi:SulP family sulfate permease
VKPAKPLDASALGQTLAWLRSLPRPRLFPLRDALREADGESLKADAKAGLKVALLAFPMALALATVAGLPAWCGLVATGAAAILAPLFSGTRFISAGPSHVTAVLLLGAFAVAGAASPESRLALLAPLLLLTGVFLLLASWLRLGKIADFIPRAVVTGLLAAAAIRVALALLPAALGIAIDLDASPLETLMRLVSAGRDLLNLDLLVALVALAVHRLMRRTHGDGTAVLAALGVSAFFAMIGENVALSQGHAPRYGLFAYVSEGAHFPGVLPANLSAHAFSVLFSPALALAALILVETASATRRAGGTVDVHQELVGLGVANLACAAVGGLPASAPGPRAALNQTAGARSGLASVTTGILILGATSLLTGILAKIPLATLAALAIALEVDRLRRAPIGAGESNGMADRAAGVITFLAALLAPLDIALYLGAAVAVGFRLKGTAPSPEDPESAAVRAEDWQI